MDLDTILGTGVVGALGALLGSLATSYNKVRGEPKDRMAHQLTADQQEHQQALDREARLERRIEALESRLDTQANLLAEQGRLQGQLSGENETLRARVTALEAQLTEAGLAHVADLATISNLRADLEAAKSLLSARDRRIEELEARVSELEEALAKPVKVKAAAKKKKVRAK